MLTKMKLALAVAVPLVAGVATYAAADAGPSADPSADPSAEMLQSKRAVHHQKMLAKYDTNKDGKLDRNERIAMRDDKLSRRFAKLDANHDGAITLDEFKARAQLRHGRHMHHHMRDAAQPGPAESGLSQLPDGGNGAAE